jgi:hypothetical protein
MNHKKRCVLLADRHHGLRDSVRGLLETKFDVVFLHQGRKVPNL